MLNRWKGENVATTEVSDILMMVDCVEEANVYGVTVKGTVVDHAKSLRFYFCEWKTDSQTCALESWTSSCSA